MTDVRERLDRELVATVTRLRSLDGAVSVMDLPATVRDHGAFADEVDGSQVSESSEIRFATRELVVERVRRLAAALDRLNAGTYGVCGECAVKISAARLRAAPEARTCVRCQSRLERQEAAGL